MIQIVQYQANSQKKRGLPQFYATWRTCPTICRLSFEKIMAGVKEIVVHLLLKNSSLPTLESVELETVSFGVLKLTSIAEIMSVSTDMTTELSRGIVAFLIFPSTLKWDTILPKKRQH